MKNLHLKFPFASCIISGNSPVRQVQQVRPSPVRPRHFPSSASGAQGSLTTEQAASPLLFGDPAGAGPERKNAGVMELVDVADSKSADGDIVWVRVPPPAPAQEFPTPFRFRLRRKLHSVGNSFAFDRGPLRWVRGREGRGMRPVEQEIDFNRLLQLRNSYHRSASALRRKLRGDRNFFAFRPNPLR